MKKTLLLGIFLMALATTGHAAPKKSVPNTEKALELNAQKGVEWQRDTQRYLAKGGATAKKGDLRLSATEIGAEYDNASSKKPKIKRLYAVGDVRASTPTEQAAADKAEYFVQKSYAILEGEKIVLKTEKQTLVAREKVEYWVAQKRVVASGGAVVESDGNTLKADVLTVYLMNARKGSSNLTVERMEAKGHVVIVTPQEQATADTGQYFQTKGIAILKGNVEIRRAGSILKGSEATVNLQTGISTLVNKTYSVDGKTGRVEGILRLEELGSVDN
jgi:lipopolysaccharide export system protein LptA